MKRVMLSLTISLAFSVAFADTPSFTKISVSKLQSLLWELTEADAKIRPPEPTVPNILTELARVKADFNTVVQEKNNYYIQQAIVLETMVQKGIETAKSENTKKIYQNILNDVQDKKAILSFYQAAVADVFAKIENSLNNISGLLVQIKQSGDVTSLRYLTPLESQYSREQVKLSRLHDDFAHLFDKYGSTDIFPDIKNLGKTMESDLENHNENSILSLMGIDLVKVGAVINEDSKCNFKEYALFLPITMISVLPYMISAEKGALKIECNSPAWAKITRLGPSDEKLVDYFRESHTLLLRHYSYSWTHKGGFGGVDKSYDTAVLTLYSKKNQYTGKHIPGVFERIPCLVQRQKRFQSCGEKSQ